MPKYHEAPIPNVADAIKKGKRIYYYRMSHPYNADLKKMYGSYNPQMVTTNELNQILKLMPIPFIRTDIRNLDEKLGEDKFDNVYYSNILCWVEPYEVEPILEKTKKCIKPGGRLFLMADCVSFDSMLTATTNVYSGPEWDVVFLPKYDDIYQIIVQRAQSRSY